MAQFIEGVGIVLSPEDKENLNHRKPLFTELYKVLDGSAFIKAPTFSILCEAKGIKECINQVAKFSIVDEKINGMGGGQMANYPDFFISEREQCTSEDEEELLTRK